MVNRCNASGCSTNYPGHNSAAVFRLPKDAELQTVWIKFLNRSDVHSLKNFFLCAHHFEDIYLNKNGSRVRLKMDMKPVPTIFSDSQKCVPKSLLPTLTKPRRPPTIRVCQEDELNKFQNQDKIDNFSQIDGSLLTDLEPGFLFMKNEDHILFYKVEFNNASVPEVTHCIRVDSDLRVKLFFKGLPLPLPQWFRQGRDTRLSSKSMLQNFISYIKLKSESHASIADELQQVKHMKCPAYSANIVRYALMMRYTSLPAYKLLLKEFNLPSISFLKKFTSGKIDSFASLKALQDKGSISADVILIFDEIYLQKCEEFSGGESFGTDDGGNPYKGMVCFMVVGLKTNVSYVIKAVPEKELCGEWLTGELLDCIKSLQENGFKVRGVVSDNHASNVSTYRILQSKYAPCQSDLFIIFNKMKIYLFFDSVHLLKNIRNNLLNRKRFLFPAFSSTALYDSVCVSGGEISWGLFHKVYEEDSRIQANMRAAPMLTSKVLHPGNCKQSVPVALAIFEPTTCAAIQKYFPEKKDAADFLHLINVWWTISNAKVKSNSRHFLGNAAIVGDGKPEFLREFADWIQRWDELNIPRCEKFTLTAQTSCALQRTLRCHASLIDDLLLEGYEFVLTARFQSDPLEKRYGQYRQMSGGRFLVSAKDIMYSEKIVKIKSLVKEGITIDESLKIKEDLTEEAHALHSRFEYHVGDTDSVQLSEDSREISDYIAGHVAYKAKKICAGCCDDQLVSREPSNAKNKYMSLLNRGGLLFPSQELGDSVAKGFALLDIGSDIIRESKMSSRKAGLHILENFLCEGRLGCDIHHSAISSLVNSILTNIFFNNQRKRTTDDVTKDNVAVFKKSKRDKAFYL